METNLKESEKESKFKILSSDTLNNLLVLPSSVFDQVKSYFHTAVHLMSFPVTCSNIQCFLVSMLFLVSSSSKSWSLSVHRTCQSASDTDELIRIQLQNGNGMQFEDIFDEAGRILLMNLMIAVGSIENINSNGRYCARGFNKSFCIENIQQYPM